MKETNSAVSVAAQLQLRRPDGVKINEENAAMALGREIECLRTKVERLSFVEERRAVCCMENERAAGVAKVELAVALTQRNTALFLSAVLTLAWVVMVVVEMVR